MLKKITKEQFIEKSIKKFGFKYNFDKFIMRGMKMLSLFICLKHGEFLLKLEYHMNSKFGCLKCGIESSESAKHKTHCKFCKKLVLIKDRWTSSNGKTVPFHINCKKIYERKQSIQKTYNITFEEYLQMFENQEHKCDICKKELDLYSQFTHLDHCHESEKVRGILCNSCNRLLGSAKDNISVLKEAINYLEKNLD